MNRKDIGERRVIKEMARRRCHLGEKEGHIHTFSFDLQEMQDLLQAEDDFASEGGN